MAAGTAKPIVPSPPELIHDVGRSYCTNWLAHIWCWPDTGDVRASGPAGRLRRSITYWGDSDPSSGCS
jgi:hypothetical protein